MNRRFAPWLALVALAVAWPAAHAACLSDAEVDALLKDADALAPAANPQGLSADDGACSRAKLIARLAARHGPPVGYKAGLTNPAVQQRFKASEPVWGALFSPMLLAEGIPVEAGFGARPLFEADLLVRVSSAAVNQARTPMEVLAAIDQVIPFIELPDLVVRAPGELDGSAIAAINVGARLGVVGTPIAVQRTQGFADALRDMTVVLKTNGVEADRGRGSDVLGHPLQAVVWLAQALAREGRALKPGDLVSLGSFSKLLPPKAGLKVSVEYQGLPGNPDVAVHFK